mmetsp:Transcript_3376/g.13414  ORF Transcript_3376/g.13414 Transcript_3376/m.13414 type:complete len:280 (-) Transcript_3376:941-1780(-)
MRGDDTRVAGRSARGSRTLSSGAPTIRKNRRGPSSSAPTPRRGSSSSVGRSGSTNSISRASARPPRRTRTSRPREEEQGAANHRTPSPPTRRTRTSRREEEDCAANHRTPTPPNRPEPTPAGPGDSDRRNSSTTTATSSTTSATTAMTARTTAMAAMTARTVRRPTTTPPRTRRRPSSRRSPGADGAGARATSTRTLPFRTTTATIGSRWTFTRRRAARSWAGTCGCASCPAATRADRWTSRFGCFARTPRLGGGSGTRTTRGFTRREPTWRSFGRSWR